MSYLVGILTMDIYFLVCLLCVHVCAHMHGLVCACILVRGAEVSVRRCPHEQPPLVFWDRVSYWDPRPADSISLAGWEAPRTHLPPLLRDYKYLPRL